MGQARAGVQPVVAAASGARRMRILCLEELYLVPCSNRKIVSMQMEEHL
jgi:hypothetical protein